MTHTQKVAFVCDRLQIPTIALVGHYHDHMLLAYESMLEESELSALIDVDVRKWIFSGIRHCDLFWVLFESISKGMAVSKAAASVLEEWKKEDGEVCLERDDFEYIIS